MPPTDFTPVSLDIETSTDDIETGVILSIGLVDFFSGEAKSFDIRHKIFTIKPESMRVNQINVLEVDSDSRLSLASTDAFLSDWLVKRSIFHVSRAAYPKPFGMNVGTFDMLFVKKHLPMTFSVFGYRSIDLNALIFVESMKHNEDYLTVKNSLKDSALLAVKNSFGGVEHEALFDAYTNCYVLAQIVGVYPEWMHGWRAS